MQYSQEHLKTMVYAEFGGQTQCIMGNWKIENFRQNCTRDSTFLHSTFNFDLCNIQGFAFDIQLFIPLFELLLTWNVSS